MENFFRAERPMVIFFDILLALCVGLILWMSGYVVYRSVFGGDGRQ